MYDVDFCWTGVTKCLDSLRPCMQYGINEFKNLLVFILLFSESLFLLSFAVVSSTDDRIDRRH